MVFLNVNVEVALLGRLEGTVGAAEGLLPRVPAVVHPELGLAVSHVATLRVRAVPAAPRPLLTLQGRHHPHPGQVADITFSHPLLKEQQSSVCVPECMHACVCVVCVFQKDIVAFM